MSLTALVTGASQGIGAAIAIALAKESEAHLFLLARNETLLEEVAGQCRAAGALTEIVPCDVVNDEQVTRAAKVLTDQGVTLDLLVNNAGHFLQQALLNTSSDAFRACLDANLTGAFHVTRAFVPAMLQRHKGTVIFMASVASTSAYSNCGAYCAAKHGLLGLARALRHETQGSGLRVTSILPGATDSPSWKDSEIPKNRLMPAHDIAQSVLDIYKLSEHTVVEEITLRPSAGDL